LPQNTRISRKPSLHTTTAGDLLDTTDETLRFPVGRFEAKPALSSAERDALIGEVAGLPAQLRDAVSGLSDEQLDTPYRPGGWTVRQVVHHVPDSHLNSYIRFKWTLTEDTPTIKAYEQGDWAELEEGRTGPVEMSLALTDALHVRWVAMLHAMSGDDWGRELRHPDHGTLLSLDWMLQLYAWHGRHHVAHINSLRSRQGW
jgi:hypothetical protein